MQQGEKGKESVFGAELFMFFGGFIRRAGCIVARFYSIFLFARRAVVALQAR